MQKVYIVAAKRTAIGKFMGAFTDVTAVELGAQCVKRTLQSINLAPEKVNEVLFGNARQAGNKPNPARQVSFFAGIPQEVPAYTINMACGSSIKAIALARQAIALGEADIVVAGGTENMTRMPFLLDRVRVGYRMGTTEIIDGMYHDGFMCPLSNMLMGQTAEKLAEKYGISRKEQDEYALQSQHRCEAATRAGRFKDEMVPVEIADRKGNVVKMETDEHPKAGANMEGLAKLPTVFKKDGTITPGNACGICDSSAAVVVAGEKAVSSLGLKPIAEIECYTAVGVDPSIMGIGPVPATRKLMELTGHKLSDFDLIEVNEAFAAQVLACDREMHFNRETMNVNGGSIALGHPIGATGARFVVTLLHEMVRRNSKHGLATLCMSGGLGMAMSFKRA
jgi:acetyl-CoA C-acetyltransferase